MTTQYFVDDVSLDREGVWAVSEETQPHVSADQVSAQLVLPTRSGARVRRLAWGLGSQGLTVGVYGPDLEERAAQLRGLLGRAQTLRVESGDVSRSVDVVSVSVSEPKRFSDVLWKLDVKFALQPFWVGGDTVEEVAAGRAPARFAKWAGTTGDVMDAVFRLKGPFTKVTLTQGGKTATAEVARTASQYLFISPTDFVAWTGGAAAWEPTDNRVPLDYGAGGPLTALSPGPDGVEVTVTGDGLTSDSKVTLRGRRWWL